MMLDIATPWLTCCRKLFGIRPVARIEFVPSEGPGA